jgi:nicotinamide-nucleotide amidase
LLISKQSRYFVNMAKAAVLTIGDELLIGQTINTNAAWIGRELALVNIRVTKNLTISDDKSEIIAAIDLLLKDSNIIIITGGLGPTKDDITKYTLAEYFSMKLKRNVEVLERIEGFFKIRGREMLEVNRQQADLPEDCRVIENKNGTAAGMWFEKDGKIIVSMPGVPYEMKAMMSETVIPDLVNIFKPVAVFHRTILTQGIGESFLADILKDWENDLRSKGHSLAYLPSPGIVKLRVSSGGKDLNELKLIVDDYCEKLYEIIPEWIYGEGDDQMEALVGKLLTNKKMTLSTAESCTGGYISHLITSVSGSSTYYMGSVVSYSNEIKTNQLKVDEKLFSTVGAVSKEVVEQMALGVKEKLKTDYSIAVSGVAGPDGGSEEKPVGTVWIAIGTPRGVVSKKYLFESNRERNIRRSALTSLNMLRKILNGLPT